MPVFLRAYSGNSTVYEVALDTGGVTVNIGPPSNPGLVDRIEFLDPGSNSGNPVVQFSVFSGPCGLPAGIRFGNNWTFRRVVS